jgi:hypothetical protein
MEMGQLGARKHAHIALGRRCAGVASDIESLCAL